MCSKKKFVTNIYQSNISKFQLVSKIFKIFILLLNSTCKKVPFSLKSYVFRLSGTRGFILILRNMLFILEKPLYVKGVETIRGCDHLYSHLKMLSLHYI